MQANPWDNDPIVQPAQSQSRPIAGSPAARSIAGTGPKLPDPLIAEGRQLDNALKRRDLATPDKANSPSATEIELAAKKESERKRAATIDAITGEVKKLYQKDIKGQPLSRLFGATEYLDSIPTNDRFRSAGNSILPLIRPLVAQTAKEGDSDKEMEVFMSYVPSNDDSDISIEQKFKMLDLLVGGMVDGKAPSETVAETGLVGNVSYEGPNPANSGGWGKARVVK